MGQIQASNKVIDLNLTISKILWNVNGLNTPMIITLDKKARPNYMLSTSNSL